ncbi:putative Protein kinase domain-containing protein [Seiridium unicorne]|uniref:Protein kinase domain-containing protein n=1 Tax=Seiridium unicorne TaxID=138068 RepID=A0ABR2UV43_9PEZI
MTGLPDVPGPQLLPFSFDGGIDDIEFIEFLGKGIHAHVWKVTINGKIYALKIFPFWQYHGPPLYALKLSKQERLGYFDPFSCECRAYARLKEYGIEELAVKCHGFIMLDEEFQQRLREKDQHDWKKDWGWSKKVAKTPLRAIVKDFVDADFGAIDRALHAGIIDSVEEQAWRTSLNMDRGTGAGLVHAMRMIHQSGILVRDVHNGNVVHGKFLDFSSAWTAPHPAFTPEVLYANRRGYMAWYKLSRKDDFAIDELISDWNESHGPRFGRIWDRLTENKEYLRRLRPRDRPVTEARSDPRYRAEMHGWSRADKKRWEMLSQQTDN